MFAVGWRDCVHTSIISFEPSRTRKIEKEEWRNKGGYKEEMNAKSSEKRKWRRNVENGNKGKNRKRGWKVELNNKCRMYKKKTNNKGPGETKTGK